MHQYVLGAANGVVEQRDVRSESAVLHVAQLADAAVQVHLLPPFVVCATRRTSALSVYDSRALGEPVALVERHADTAASNQTFSFDSDRELGALLVPNGRSVQIIDTHEWQSRGALLRTSERASSVAVGDTCIAVGTGGRESIMHNKTGRVLVCPKQLPTLHFCT